MILIVTSSVRIAGSPLVFSYLIVPALAGIMLSRSGSGTLVIGTLVSVIGMTASAATVVCAFGLTLIVLWVIYLGARGPRTVHGLVLGEDHS